MNRPARHPGGARPTRVAGNDDSRDAEHLIVSSISKCPFWSMDVRRMGLLAPVAALRPSAVQVPARP